ncbi:E3 ubiquitin protein ligase UPL1-like protein [Tanacetum coccineum]
MAKERRISGIVFIIPSPSPPPSLSDNRFTSPSSTGTQDPYGDLEKRFTSSSASAPSESSHTNTPLFSLIRVDSLSLSESIDPPRQKRLKLPSGMNLAWVLADCRNWYETALKKAPPIPDQFLSFVETALQKAQEKDSIPLMQPDICIVNFYETDDGLGLHQDLKGRLNVHFQGEEGIDAGGLTREWYQLLSRVIFDKGALLFTTGGNNATFQPNPNSVCQTEHLSYFKFVGHVVTYHDIEAVDPDYYKNLKWLLENDVSDILDLTFSMDADEEKQILYEKSEVTDHELKPGGRNTRLTEETKHEYVDLVAEHILTNATRPQINSFLEGFNELIPRDLISIFNDKELELLISGLPEIDCELKLLCIIKY